MEAIPARLPAPGGRPDLLVIAGEHSGDEHAARMVSDLLASGKIKTVCAVGGPAVQRAGAQLLFDLTSFSVVGLFEVLKHYGEFKQLFKAVVEWIAQYRPRAVCLVDYPGFNLRLAKALKKAGLSRKGGGDIAVYDYIGPQIWAWKARRRFSMAQTLDGLGVIFPFETRCYADTALPVSFVGHPFVDKDFKNPVRYDASGDILLLPGSRPAAVGRIFPRLLAGFALWRQTHPDARACVLYPSEFILEKLKAALEKLPDIAQCVACVPAEGAQPVGARAVLMSSGTMSLCCCLAGIPGAVVYHAHPFTYAIGRLLVKVPYLGIANLLLEKNAWPELLQSDANPGNLSLALNQAITPERAAQAAVDAAELRQLLGCGVDAFSRSPARWLLEKIKDD